MKFKGQIRKKLKVGKLIKPILIIVLIFFWLFTGSPSFKIPGFGIFPPKLYEVSAAACTILTLATGTDPATATIAPGSGMADRGLFTLTGNGSSCATTTIMVVTLAGSGTPYDGLAEVRITNDAGTTTYFSPVTSFVDNTVEFSGGTAISGITTGTVTFRIKITPKIHTVMPSVPGASYALAAYVSSFTSGETEAGTDSNPNTTTIDNTSPSNVSTATATADVEHVDLAWTNPGDSDVTTGGTILVLRHTSAISDTPTEGQVYSAGQSVGSSYVACVNTGSPPSTTCIDSGLTAGTPYHYKIFAQDSRGNYSQNGVVPTGSPRTPTGTTTLTTSSDPSPATVAPGSAIRSAGQFTYTTSTGSDTVTGLTLTLGGSPAGSYASISSVSIRSGTCAGTLYFAAETPTGDSVVFSGGTALDASSGGNTYLICVTPKDQTLAAGTYTVSPYVSNTWTSGGGNAKSGTDTNSNALTIDNTVPSGAGNTSGTAGVGKVTLNWTTSSSGDFDTSSGSVVLRWTAGSAGAEVPAEGNSSYVAGDDIAPTAKVACVISSVTSTPLSKIDGSGGSVGCTTSTLTAGQQYAYKVFQRDQYGNYDAGVSIGTFTPTAASSTFAQNRYAWYFESTDLTNPTDLWPSGSINLGENTAITIIPDAYDPPNTTQKLRLRVNFSVATSNMDVTTKYFKLEYRIGTDSDCSTGSWTDVNTGNAWEYASSGITDGADITASLSDTSTGKGEEYVKSRSSQLNHVAANIGEIVEYDFHIVGTAATTAQRYLFRVVETDSGGTGETAFASYTSTCPILFTEPGTANLLRHGNVFSAGSEKGFYWAN